MSETLYGFRANKTKAEIPEDKYTNRTLLWSNSSPTSSFAAQVITLSQSIFNFDYIEIEHTVGSIDITGGVKKTTRLAIPSNLSSGKTTNISSIDLPNFFQRTLYPNFGGDAKNIRIMNCDIRAVGGSSSADNAYLIPEKIYGIKYPS